jgi:hypothetical protein
MVTDSCRTPTLRRVFVTFPHVAPPGVEWNANHEGRRFELTSFKGGAVEVYVQNPNTGLWMYQGSVRDYAPGKELRDALRAAWVSVQPSKAALKSFNDSAKEEG